MRIQIWFLPPGEGRVDGSVRALVTRQRETLRAAVLDRALERHPDRTVRPVWVFPQFDKLSQAWILALPSASTFLASPVFQETMAWHLCLPRPACRDLVGTPACREGAVVDTFAEQVMCAKLPFDTFRVRHDTIKVAIVERANHARVRVEAEVFGLFRDIIPAEAMGKGEELGTVRQRSGCVPDTDINLLIDYSL